MESLTRKILEIYIFLLSKVEKCVGLSNFCYKNKQYKVLLLLSCAIRISFIIVYPIVCKDLLTVFLRKETGVTYFARNITFGFNWLLLVIIFANETFIKSNKQASFDDFKALFDYLIKSQNLTDNIKLLMRCTLKCVVVFLGLFHTSYKKYTLKMTQNLTMLETTLMSFLFLPFVVFVLATNRIYVTNTVIKQCLITNVKRVNFLEKDFTVKIQALTVNYNSFHRFFLNFNKSNEINLLAVLTFCILNIVYEVK